MDIPARGIWRAAAAATAILLGLIAGATAARAPAAGAPPPHSFRDCPDCPLMTVVPAGRFTMGSPATEAGRADNEGPQHAVVIPRRFAVATFDVSRAEYETFATQTNLPAPDPRCDWRAPTASHKPFVQGPTEPVVCVSWRDATAYAAWLGRRTGKPYRLLTEAEWEYAARAGSTTARPWGEAASRDQANYGADPCCGPFAGGGDRWLHTSPAGSFAPNAFGLYDMIGNVWQWVQDCSTAEAGDNYTGAPANGAARLTGACDRHVARGGGWFHGPDQARSASRVADLADFRVSDIGFRVGRDL
jgi:formylglycine-generating enzyme required for sulfatase activity